MCMTVTLPGCSVNDAICINALYKSCCEKGLQTMHSQLRRDPSVTGAGTACLAQCIINRCPPTGCQWADPFQWLSTSACSRGFSTAKEGCLPKLGYSLSAGFGPKSCL